MPIVVDVSVLASWHFPDEGSGYGEYVARLLRTEQARVPAIWWFEMRNVLLIGERRNRVTEADNNAFLTALDTFEIEIDVLPDERDVFALARRHRLTCYDACYLELAQREELPLATLDKALITAAQAEKIVLISL